jgi:hypothetical protein
VFFVKRRKSLGRFLERYQAGEHEQVWDELISLGDQIYDGPFSDDALGVAYETMRRVRQNIEMLIPRLCAIGYQFGYGWVQPFLGKQLSRQTLSREISFDFHERRMYMEMLERATECPPLFLPANENEEYALYMEQMIQALNDPGSEHEKSLREMQDAYRKALDTKTLVKQLENMVGILPLSVRAWYEIVGGVNFVGHHQEWYRLIVENIPDLEKHVFDTGGYYLHPLAELDPLFIPSLTKEKLTFIEQFWHISPQQQPLFLDLWPDETAKYLDSVRDYAQIMVPCYAMDAMVQGAWSGLTFVQYLRRCFQWGGFPGWRKRKVYPKEDIDTLITGLLPF